MLDYIETDVDLLKIDVEVVEFDILKELAVTGKIAFVKNVIMEYHHLEENGLIKFLAFFDEHGFDCWIFDTNVSEPKWFLTTMIFARKKKISKEE